MDVVEKAGTSFAFPTRTVHLQREPDDFSSRKVGRDPYPSELKGVVPSRTAP